MDNVQTNKATPQDIKTAMHNANNFQGTFNLDKTGFNPMMPGHVNNHGMILRQEPRTVKEHGAGIGLTYAIRKEMALMLDDHLCSLNTALRQYQKHHWLSEGSESFGSIHELLQEHIEQTQKNIDEIGERIARLGGIPTAHPVTQHDLSYIKHEAEGRYSMRDYLRNDLEHELKIQDMFRKQIRRAHELGDFGTVEVLEEVLKDREDLGYHLYSVLEDDSLMRGMRDLIVDQNNIVGDGRMNSENKLQ
jgi:DNA-binding ferritin-like protein